jgi:hypothetical protein
MTTVMIIWTMSVLCFTPHPSHAIMTKATVPELTAGATGVVRGHVQDVASRWDSEGKTILTYVTISVDEWLKGDGPDAVTVRVPGGIVGDVGLWVEDAPVFAEGQEVITFLEPSDDGSLMQVRGDFQGEFTIENGRVVGSGLPLVDFVAMVKSIVEAQEEETRELTDE